MSAPETLGAGSVNPNTGKPVFVAASQSLYTARERDDLTNADRINFRTVQLQKAIESIARRDSVYHDLAQENYTGGSITYQVLGSPYPVIEPFPSVGESYKATRWYEVGISVAVPAAIQYTARHSARWRHVRNYRMKFFLPTTTAFAFLTAFAIRGQNRLLGMAENEYEAMKYGVYDTPENLQRKANNWAKYAAYKEEWLRRYNFTQYGERPSETGKFLSACWFPSSKITFNTRTDYPARKNPMWLTTAPLRDMHSEWAFTYALPPKNLGAAERPSDDPVQVGRPELSERYGGPQAREVYYATK